MSNHHDALAVLSSLVREDGQRWGDACSDFQWRDARNVLGTRQPFHYLTRPRGGSKTTDLAGIALACLCVAAPAGSRSYAVAGDRDQAGLLLDALAGFVARTPGLGSEIALGTQKAENRRTGASLTVMAADSASAFGLRPWFVVVDELAQWGTTREPRRLCEAIVSAMPKVPGARMAVITTAGDPAHWSAGILEAAKASPQWAVNETPGRCRGSPLRPSRSSAGCCPSPNSSGST